MVVSDEYFDIRRRYGNYDGKIYSRAFTGKIYQDAKVI